MVMSMGNSYGASKTPDLFRNCVLWFTGAHIAAISGDFDEFPIIPSGVTVTNNPVSSGWIKDDLLNNKSVMRFDGSTNYVSLSDNAAFEFGSGDFTICFWAYMLSIPNGWVSYLSHRYGSTDQCSFGLDFNNSSASPRYPCIEFYATSNGSSTYSLAYWPVTTASIINQWRYITLIKVGTTISLYIDLTLKTPTDATCVSSIYDSSQPLYIGCELANGTPVDYINSRIKDLLIYKGRALTLPELTLLMRKTHPITGTGLIPGPYSYWRGA